MNNTFSMAIPKVAPEHKYMLTIQETCGVFGLGEHTVRKLLNSNPNADYILRVGTKTLIKKSLFESYILKESVLHY